MARRRRRVPRYQREAETKDRSTTRKGHIPADPSQQAPNNSYSPPLFYVDREFRCLDCGRREIWSAEQQRWWYEVAKGPIFSVAVRCRACRAKKRDAHGGTPLRSHAERTRRRDTDSSTGR